MYSVTFHSFKAPFFIIFSLILHANKQPGIPEKRKSGRAERRKKREGEGKTVATLKCT